MSTQQERPDPGVVERVTRACLKTGIRRPADGRWVAGVAAGIAERYDVDPVVVRIGFILVGFFGGLGLPLYLFAWLLLPAHDERIALERAIADGDPRAIVLGVAALLSLVTLGSWGRSDSGGAVLVSLALLVGIAWVLVRSGRGQPLGAAPPAAEPEPGPTVPDTPTSTSTPTTTAPAGAAATAPPAPLYRPAPPAPRPVAPSPPRRVDPDRRVRRLVTVLTLGLVLLAYQATLLVAQALGAPIDHHLLALCVVLGVVGLVLVGTGLAGHRARLVSATAWLLGLFLFLSTLPGAVVDGASISIPDSDDSHVGDVRWAPTSVSELQDSYTSQIGESVLDLSGLDPSTVGERRIDVAQGLGDLRIILPAGLTARVEPHVGLGQWCVEAPERPRVCSSTGDAPNPVTVGSGSPRLIIDASVGTGELTVTQEDAR